VADRDIVRELLLENPMVLGTKLKFFAAYHPQTNGETKVVNRSLGNLLRCLVGEHART
jgi:hypothetical protein